ncbi:MAG: hypothetical protein JWL73_3170 [Actinomycetia bacterium]|nr:hypothetical protein [Actinomycetes bacterium]
MGLQGFERRLERLVEGAFSKAFRSGLQPIEIGRKMVRELDARRTIGLRGTVAPNHIEVSLSPADFEGFASFAEALARELADLAREHAREEGYHFIGPVTVELFVDDDRRRGDCAIRATIREGAGGRAGALVLADGRRVVLGDAVATIGRLATCTVVLGDSQASRVHAEIRPDADGYVLVDLGSTNGTMVNEALVREQPLKDGDQIRVGSTVLRFEAS